MDALLLDTVIAEEQANIAYEFTFLLMAVFAFVYVVVVKKQRIRLSAERPKIVGALCETADSLPMCLPSGPTPWWPPPMISSYCIASAVEPDHPEEKAHQGQYAVIAVAAVGIAILGMGVHKRRTAPHWGAVRLF